MSTSSEIIDSRKSSIGKVPEKSNFSQTCNLLSQYIKDKGTIADLNLGIKTGVPEIYRQSAPAATTMNLFPVVSKHVKSTAVSTPMTIFYGGQVIVLNDLPAEKAKEIILFASSNSCINSASPPNVFDHRPTIADLRLPIARNASLTRFLEKRKDRIIARAPYPVRASKQDVNKAWLGLGALPPMQS